MLQYGDQNNFKSAPEDPAPTEPAPSQDKAQLPTNIEKDPTPPLRAPRCANCSSARGALDSRGHVLSIRSVKDTDDPPPKPRDHSPSRGAPRYGRTDLHIRQPRRSLHL